MAINSSERAAIERASAAPMLAQVTDWSCVNSGSRNLDGLATMASLLADAFSLLPGRIELVEPSPAEIIAANGEAVPVAHGRNLLLVVRPEAPVRVLLTGHMDTVFGADHPFQLAVLAQPDVLNGPGCADMKGGIAVMLAALAAIEGDAATTSRLGYDVVINSDEEVGSPGSAALLSARARGKVAALTYEPALADGTLAGARPGSGNYSFVVRGRAAHAGRNPEEGRNAIVAAGDLALRLAALAGPGLTANPARIDGGGPNNMVPDLAVLRANLRPSGAAELAQAEAGMEAAVAAVSLAHEVSIERHGAFGRPPKPLDGATERLFGLVRDCGTSVGLSVHWRATGGVCDGNNIAAMGVPVVDTMGVRGGAIHTADEFMIVNSLAERAALSTLVLMRLAARGAA